MDVDIDINNYNYFELLGIYKIHENLTYNEIMNSLDIEICSITIFINIK